MAKKRQCVDVYGERLKVGDEVIPVMDEALIIGISGVISEIEYSERYNNYYITITDKKGKTLLKGVDAKCYTTQERFDERENQEYVYSLTFYDSKFWTQTNIPLTNKTNPNYEIPKGTCLITLDAEHLKEKGKQLTQNSWSCDSYISSNIYYFIVDSKVELCHEESDNFYYLLNHETNSYRAIGEEHRIFKGNKEMKKFIKGIIEYFNNADLTYVNNDDEFKKNEKGKEFERKLIEFIS